MTDKTLINLPLDLLRHLCQFLTPKNVANLALASNPTWSSIHEDLSIWSMLYARCFPSPSLLQLKEESPPLLPSLKRYQRRLLATRRDLQLVPGAFTIVGHSCDAGSGNITPVRALIEVSGYFFQASAEISNGTIHNNACKGRWQKGFFGAEKGQWKMSFEEVLPTNRGKFIYQGTLAKDTSTGRHVTGTFSWSLFPSRVGGTFSFQIVP